MRLCLISQTNCHWTSSKSDAPDKVVRHSQMIYQLHYEFDVSGVRFCCIAPLRSWDFCALEGMKYEVVVMYFEQAIRINQQDYCALVCVTEVAILADGYPRWSDLWYTNFIIGSLTLIFLLTFDILHGTQHLFWVWEHKVLLESKSFIWYLLEKNLAFAFKFTEKKDFLVWCCAWEISFSQ